MVKVGEGFGSDPRSHIYVHKNDKTFPKFPKDT